MAGCLEIVSSKSTGKVVVIATWCLLAGCDPTHDYRDAGVANQSGTAPAPSPAPAPTPAPDPAPGPRPVGADANGYRLVIQVTGIDFTQVSGGTLFTIRTQAGRVVASAGFPRVWNSYCANDLRELHVFTTMPPDAEYTTTRLPKKVATLKTAYAFSTKGALRVDDRGNVETRDFRQYQVKVAGGRVSDMVRVQAPEQLQTCSPFIADGHVFFGDGGLVYACALEEAERDCEVIAIAPGTYPYVYAEHDGRVVVATNWGDVLIHNPDGWCRAENVGERYACPDSGLPSGPGPSTPTGVQFYSSIHYQDKTYLGKFPDGRLYEFDGESLALSADSPPSLGKPGSELQSLAIYCGDLFAGRWPRGTVWKRDLETASWAQVARLFSHPSEIDPWIPYYGLRPEGIDSSFFGQRVSSLALMTDSLFASTSNLSSWDESIGDPDFLTAEQAAEYGALHRIRRPGCATALAPDTSSFSLKFDFTPESITIRNREHVLVRVENNGTVPTADDQVSLGEGVFGRLSGVGLKYRIEPRRGP